MKDNTRKKTSEKTLPDNVVMFPKNSHFARSENRRIVLPQRAAADTSVHELTHNHLAQFGLKKGDFVVVKPCEWSEVKDNQICVFSVKERRMALGIVRFENTGAVTFYETFFYSATYARNKIELHGVVCGFYRDLEVSE